MSWKFQSLTWIVVVGGLALTAMAGARNFSTPDQRLVPSLDGAGDTLMLLTALGIPWWIYLWFRRARPTWAERRLWQRVLYGVTALLAHIALVGAIWVGVFSLDDEWLFGPRVLDVQDSPDGQRVGYLYSQFLGRLMVFERARFGVVLHRVHDAKHVSSAEAMHLVWSEADGRFQIQGGSPPEPFRGFGVVH